MSDWDDIPAQAEAIEEKKDEGYVWSEEQLRMKEWAANSKKNGRVTARAGTGKTKSIEAMVVPAAPEQKILYVVFNKKNKLEAEEKIRDPRVDIKTFNGLGYGFVKQHWSKVKPDDEVERDRIREAAPKIGKCLGALATALQLVAWCKNTAPFSFNVPVQVQQIAEEQGIVPEYEDEQQGWTTQRLAEVACQAMRMATSPDTAGRVSFNDQVWLPVVMGWAKPWWDLIIVDEAQDTNLTQQMMIQKCFKPRGRILLVGDDRQAIYQFRGAAQNSMADLAAAFKTEELTLTTTYRCGRRIVEEAKKEVPDFKAPAKAHEGKVTELYGTEKVVMQARPGDAILSRINAPLLPICLALLKKGVPARIEGRDIGRQLSQIAQRFNAVGVMDFLKKVKAWADRKVERIKAKDLGFAQAQGQIEAVWDQAEIFYAVAEDAPTVAVVMLRLQSLFQDTDERSTPAVILSSVHRAKGLEWDRVFALQKTLRREKGGEEANIWYVLVTRAKKELVWVS